MRYRIKSGEGFSGLTVATDDPVDAISRARQFEEQGLEVTIIDEDDVGLSVSEFENLVPRVRRVPSDLKSRSPNSEPQA